MFLFKYLCVCVSVCMCVCVCVCVGGVMFVLLADFFFNHKFLMKNSLVGSTKMSLYADLV